MKKLLKHKYFILFSLILAIIIFMPGADSKVNLYYSGDAISFENRLVFGSTNSGRAEIFVLNKDRIEKKFTIKSKDQKNPEFRDLVFVAQESKLYLYLINGDYLLKYDISNLIEYHLVGKIKDNSYDYLLGLERAGDRFITVGTKGVKVWNNDLQIIRAYDIGLKNSKSIVFDSINSYLFFVKDGSFVIMDGLYGSLMAEDDLYILEDHNRRPYNDDLENAVYIVDDYSLKKYSHSGEHIEFKHISKLGYDVDGVRGADHIYFSGGLGVVKLRKSDLKPIDWVYTTNLGEGSGWAMGLRAVKVGHEERVVVFNNNNILVLNQNLDMIDYYSGTAIATQPQQLYLQASSYIAGKNQPITVNGGGFEAFEDLEIIIAGKKYQAQADQQGSFRKTINTPDVSPQRTAIKTNGIISGLTYSVSFEIK